MIVTIVATLGVLGLLILVHELGHYMAARVFDIHVSRFSIGLGPKVFAFQRGETEFCISALPLGGYVKLTGMKEMDLIEGDDGEQAVDPSRTFSSKPASVRAVVLAAGVAMNAVLAVVLFAGVALVWGMPWSGDAVVGRVVAEFLPRGTHELASIPVGTRITHVGDREVATMDDVSRAIMAAAPSGSLTFSLESADPVTITIPERARDRQLLPIALEPVREAAPVFGGIQEDGAAAAAGLKPGDRVLAVDGREVGTWQQLSRVVQDNPGRELNLLVQRDGSTFTTTLTPITRYLGEMPLGRMGADLDLAEIATPRLRVGPTAAAAYGVTQSWEIITLMGSFVAGLFDGRHSAREMGGPILIAQISGAASRAGIATLLFFAALLSINLAVMNLLPIPALDGGHLALLALEKVRGRPAGERAQAALGRLGLATVAMMMLWAVTADVMRILGV